MACWSAKDVADAWKQAHPDYRLSAGARAWLTSLRCGVKLFDLLVLAGDVARWERGRITVGVQDVQAAAAYIAAGPEAVEAVEKLHEAAREGYKARV